MKERDFIIKFLTNSWTPDEITCIKREEEQLTLSDRRIAEISEKHIRGMSKEVIAEEGFLRYLDKNQQPKHVFRRDYATLVLIKNQIPKSEYDPKTSDILSFKMDNMFVFMGFEWELLKQEKNPKFVRLEKPFSYEEFQELRRELKIEEGRAFVYFDSTLSEESPLKDFSEE